VKGHSTRHGRSRCRSKIGPSKRARQSKAILRREAIKQGEAGQRPSRADQPVVVIRGGRAATGFDDASLTAPVACFTRSAETVFTT
jgi:hypothetical protein